MKVTDINKQLEIIKRGAVEIISENELKRKLEISINEKRPLIVKAGFDPTAPDLHLGHTVLLRKLRQFQDLGHRVVFLIGDFTARIGDPSGRSEKRKQLTEKEVLENAVTYKKQVNKVLNVSKLKVVFNSKWFDKMPGIEFGRLLTHYTATRLLEREDFASRIREGKPLFMSEFIYPILQGYDSVVLKADIEIGGTDQIFNLLVGRDLQKDFALPPQVVITMPLLEGTDGVQKMSKAFGNYIGISEPAKEMFGKIMSISDEAMHKYYTLLTDSDLDSVRKLHPKEAKLALAQIITAQYHGRDSGKKAREDFNQTFSQRELPEDSPVYEVKDRKASILDILIDSGLVSSRNEARRLIAGGGVYIDGERIDKEGAVIGKEGILKVGKKRFLRLKIL